MIPGVLTGAVMGGIGGLIGWGIGKLLDPENPPRWISAICVAIALVAIRPVSDYINRPSPESVLADLEKQEPLYSAIRTKHPEIYEEVRQAVAEGIETNDTAALRAKIRAVVLPTIMEWVPTASSGTLVKFTELATEQLRYVARVRPEACPQFLTGRDIGADRLFPTEMNQRELALYNTLLIEQPVINAQRASESEIGEAIIPIVPRLGARLGITEAQVLDAAQQKGPPERQCSVAAELYDEILKLPATSRDRLLRALLSPTTPPR